MFRVYDDVPSSGQLLPMQPDDLADTPPHAVPRHRAAQRFLDAESITAVRQLVRAIEKGEERIGAAPGGAVNGVKIAFPQQPRLARKAEFAPLTPA
jgi:hypothetical protein